MQRFFAGAGVVLLAVAAIAPIVLATLGPLTDDRVPFLAVPAFSGAAALVLLALAARPVARRTPPRTS